MLLVGHSESGNNFFSHAK